MVSLKKSDRARRNIGSTKVQSNRTVSFSVFQFFSSGFCTLHFRSIGLVWVISASALTAAISEDILFMLCLSWCFMSFEAQRKSKYAKLLQFFDSNSRLRCRCRHFLRMAVVCRYFIWALSLLFGPCRLSEFTLAGPLYSLQSTFVP